MTSFFSILDSLGSNILERFILPKRPEPILRNSSIHLRQNKHWVVVSNIFYFHPYLKKKHLNFGGCEVSQLVPASPYSSFTHFRVNDRTGLTPVSGQTPTSVDSLLCFVKPQDGGGVFNGKPSASRGMGGVH